MEKKIILVSPKELGIYLDIMDKYAVLDILNKHKLKYKKYLSMKRFLFKSGFIKSSKCKHLTLVK